MRNLIKLLVITLSLVTTSCGVQRGHWVKDEIIICDTFVLPEIHEHLCDTTGCRCLYIESWEIEFIDTLEIEYYEPKIKVRKNGRSLRN